MAEPRVKKEALPARGVRYAAEVALKKMAAVPGLLDAIDRCLVESGGTPDEVADWSRARSLDLGFLTADGECPPDDYHRILAQALRMRLAQLHQS